MWTNIYLSEMYQFLGIILKMSFTSSGIDDFKSLLYSLTHATTSPTCQFEIKDHPSLTQWYMSHSTFFQICAIFHPESGIIKEGDKCHGLRIEIKHLNKIAFHTIVPEK